MSLLAQVVARLAEARVGHCLIGAAALAIHGVARSTQDDDLLVTDTMVLKPGFWGPLEPSVVRSIRGDEDDPLAGAVRLEHPEQRSVDVIVGRWAWQRDVITRARTEQLPDLALPVAEVGDLALLKLDAAGPQDRLDVEMLLAVHGEALADAISARLSGLPAALEREWREWRRPTR